MTPDSGEPKNVSLETPKKKSGRTKSASLKRPFQKYPMVEIWWDDPTALTHGWLDNSDLPNVKPALVVSVGFLILETSDYIVYASDLDGAGHHNGRTQINRGVIKKVRVLRNADIAPQQSK